MSLPAPPNRFAAGSAPFASLSVIVSLPPCPKTWISAVLATVGVPPVTATAPPLTRILPAASRLTTIELLAASPKTVSTPLLNDAVVAALACAVRPANAAVASAPPASSRRVMRRQLLFRPWFMSLPPRAAGRRSTSSLFLSLPLETHGTGRIFRSRPLERVTTASSLRTPPAMAPAARLQRPPASPTRAQANSSCKQTIPVAV